MEQRRSVDRSCHRRADEVFVRVSIFPKGIPIEIAVRLYQPVHSGKIVVRRSHDLVIEGLDPAKTEECSDDTAEGEVLHAAVNELACLYNAARAQGLQPNASWLKANADFT